MAVETSAYFLSKREPFESALVEQFSDQSSPVPSDKLQLFSRTAAEGGATAGDAIGTLTGIDTTVDISRMSVLRAEHLSAKLGDDRRASVAVELTGLPSGYVLVLFDEPSARAVAEATGTGPVGESLGPTYQSAVEEICNVTTGGFVDGRANVLGTSNRHTPPEFVPDRVGARRPDNGRPPGRTGGRVRLRHRRTDV